MIFHIVKHLFYFKFNYSTIFLKKCLLLITFLLNENYFSQVSLAFVLICWRISYRKLLANNASKWMSFMSSFKSLCVKVNGSRYKARDKVGQFIISCLVYI